MNIIRIMKYSDDEVTTGSLSQHQFLLGLYDCDHCVFVAILSPLKSCYRFQLPHPMWNYTCVTPNALLLHFSVREVILLLSPQMLLLLKLICLWSYQPLVRSLYITTGDSMPSADWVMICRTTAYRKLSLGKTLTSITYLNRHIHYLAEILIFYVISLHCKTKYSSSIQIHGILSFQLVLLHVKDNDK